MYLVHLLIMCRRSNHSVPTDPECAAVDKQMKETDKLQKPGKSHPAEWWTNTEMHKNKDKDKRMNVKGNFSGVKMKLFCI